MPMRKLTVSVTEVMVMETAASLSVCPILSETDFVTEVLLQAASITKVSSIPIPGIETFITWDCEIKLTGKSAILRYR